MKKALIPLALPLLLLLILCGCREEEAAEYSLYFPTQGGGFSQAALETEAFTLPEGEEPIRALLEALLQGPQGEGLRRGIPLGVTLGDYQLKEGVLTVDFSSRYGLLSGIDLTLADYSVTMTLSQLPEIDSVVTVVEGDPITYRHYQNLRPQDVLLSLGGSEDPETP